MYGISSSYCTVRSERKPINGVSGKNLVSRDPILKMLTFSSVMNIVFLKKTWFIYTVEIITNHKCRLQKRAMQKAVRQAHWSYVNNVLESGESN